jgi:hypothetical protein
MSNILDTILKTDENDEESLAETQETEISCDPLTPHHETHVLVPTSGRQPPPY